MEAEKKRTIMYSTMNLHTKKIGIVPEMEKALKKMREDIDFYTRGTKFGTVDTKFRNQKLAAMTIKTKEWKLFPTYLGRSVLG